MAKTRNVRYHSLSCFPRVKYLCSRVRFLRQISVYLSDKKTPFKPNRVRVLPDGLASVERGLQMLKNNEVHAEKLVYRISETPGLKVN